MARSNNITIEKGRQLFKSKAFISLTGKSTQVYCILLTKRTLKEMLIGRRKCWVITNNGEIQFTYDEAESYGISRDQFRRAIDQLPNRGFINVISGYPHNFEFIDNWLKFGRDDFKLGLRHTMSVPFKKPKTKDDKHALVERFKNNRNNRSA